MTLDDLTIGDARKLAALFSTTTLPTAPSVSPFSPLIGKLALVRSRGSGVWAGTVIAAHEGSAGHTLTLTNARRLWQWTGAGECASLALTGPSGGKIGPACQPIVAEVLEAHELTASAASAIAQVPVWTK